jgi:transcriptional regulator with XRE-family HTH domain
MRLGPLEHGPDLRRFRNDARLSRKQLARYLRCSPKHLAAQERVYHLPKRTVSAYTQLWAAAQITGLSLRHTAEHHRPLKLPRAVR